MSEVDIFAAAMRKTETGRYDPKFRATSYVGWDSVSETRLVGSYSIPEAQWGILADQAGLPGARWQDPAAQDIVMKTIFTQLFEEYQDWRLVAVAWKAGQEVADNLVNDPSGLQREKTGNLKKYVDTVIADAKTYQGPELPMPEEGQETSTNPFAIAKTFGSSQQGAASPKPGDMVRNTLITMRDSQRKRPPMEEEVEGEQAAVAEGLGV